MSILASHFSLSDFECINIPLLTHHRSPSPTARRCPPLLLLTISCPLHVTLRSRRASLTQVTSHAACDIRPRSGGIPRYQLFNCKTTTDEIPDTCRHGYNTTSPQWTESEWGEHAKPKDIYYHINRTHQRLLLCRGFLRHRLRYNLLRLSSWRKCFDALSSIARIRCIRISISCGSIGVAHTWT